MTLLSFHDDPAIKAKYVSRVKAHAAADEIIHGTYWTNGRGCAVGCTIHSGNHNAYETELGLPEWLARLEDTLFENLPNGEAFQFPLRFLQAIPIGIPLDKVKWRFCAFLLEENKHRVQTLEIASDLKTKVISAIDTCLSLHVNAIKTGVFDESAAESARSSAESAAWSAAWSASSAESAAWSAAWSASSAWSAARSAAESARSAESAAWSAASAWSAARSEAESARSAAWSAAFIRYSEKLIELLESACN